jgi:hypothetical protein
MFFIILSFSSGDILLLDYKSNESLGTPLENVLQHIIHYWVVQRDFFFLFSLLKEVKTCN